MQNIETLFSYIMMLIGGMFSSAFMLIMMIVPMIFIMIMIVLVVLLFVIVKKCQKNDGGKSEESNGKKFEKSEMTGSPVCYVNIQCSCCGSVSIIEKGTPFLCPDCGSAEGEILS